VLPAGEVSGIATHYVLQGLPNCSYPSPPADGLLVNPSLPGPISLLVKQGSSPYWLALLAMNTGNPLASVQVRSESGGGWYSLVRASYNYWVARSGAGSGPFTVRLTDTQGHVVTVQGIALSPGVVQGTGTWMYGAGTTTGPAPEPAGTTPPAPRTSRRPVASATSGRALASRAAGELDAGPGTPRPTSLPSATPTC
jgi:hypothetical protein